MQPFPTVNTRYNFYLLLDDALEQLESFGADRAVGFEHEEVFDGGVTLPIPNIFDDIASHNLGNLDLNVHTLGSVLKFR